MSAALWLDRTAAQIGHLCMWPGCDGPGVWTQMCLTQSSDPSAEFTVPGLEVCLCWVPDTSRGWLWLGERHAGTGAL